MKNSLHTKYLLTTEQDISWGLTINSVGYQQVGKYALYPPSKHPVRYLFKTNKGRVLDEFQLLYIVEGEGIFCSDSVKKTSIKKGQMFILFPNEWHNYSPSKESGWDEYWIGFSGNIMENYSGNKFFSKENPIFNIGVREEIVQLYKQAIKIACEQNPGYQQMLAGIVSLLLGYTYSYNKSSSLEDMELINGLNKAKIIMKENFSNSITPKEIAESIHMSYSWFRQVFKKHTGFSPIHYIQELRIYRAKELLTNTNLRVKEIALDIGYSNSEYFCTLFKSKAGLSPQKYRELTQGKYLQTE